RELAAAYQNRGAGELDRLIYPDARFVARLKSALLRLELGPYRDLASHRVELLAAQRFVAPVSLSTDARIHQRFRAGRNGLKAIDVQTVTHGRQHGSVDFVWRLYEVAAGGARLYAAGVVPAARVGDWEMVRLRLGPAWDSAGKEYELTLEPAGPQAGESGFPAYEAGTQPRVELEAGAARRAGPGALNLALVYVD
ncbi:MAG TPA: hypothetical protein VNT02_04035, partial [Burkholderiales bacterium]|nr:hypothetical protein [Burkholderiales bacterium]